MRLEAPPQKGFHKWQSIGDTIVGRFIEYKKVNGTYGEKSELRLKVKPGTPNADDDDTITVPCPTMLERTLDKADEDGFLDRNKVLKIRFSNTKHVGQPQPMKEFEVDLEEAKPTAAKHTTIVAKEAPVLEGTSETEDEIPF